MSKVNASCVMKVSELDNKLAEMPALQGFTPAVIAQNRGFYTVEHPDFESKSLSEQASLLADYITKSNEEKRRDKLAVDSGIASANSTLGALYRQFCDVIPIENRVEVIEQLSSLFTTKLNAYCNLPENKDKSRRAVLDAIGGVNKIRQDMEKYIDSFALKLYDKIQQDAKKEYAEGSPEQKKKLDRVARYNTMISIRREGAWLAALELMSRDLLETERLKLGKITGEQYHKFLENLEAANLEDGEIGDEVLDAEDSTIERWMLAADTVDSVSAVSAEVRRFFNSITSNEFGLLLVKKRYNTQEMYTKMIELRKNTRARGSKDFLEEIAKVGKEVPKRIAAFKNILEERSSTTEGAALLSKYNKIDISNTTELDKFLQELLNDSSYSNDSALLNAATSLRTALSTSSSSFTNFCSDLLVALTVTADDSEVRRREKLNMATLMYVNFDKASLTYTTPYVYKDSEGGIKVKLTREEETPRTLVQNLQKAVAYRPTLNGYKQCIFQSNGFINDLNAKAFFGWADNTGYIPDVKAIIKKHEEAVNPADSPLTEDYMRETVDFILKQTLLSDAVELDIDTLVQSPESFESFIDAIIAYGNAIVRKGKHFNIKDSNGFNKTRELLEKITATDYYIPQPQRMVVGKSVRFKDSNYFSDTSQFSLNKKLEVILNLLNKKGTKGEITKQAKEDLKNYLISAFLSNPMFATPAVKKVTRIENGVEVFEEEEDWSKQPTIHHAWLRQLWNVANGLNYNKAFVDYFTNNPVSRGLGYWNDFTPFDNFTELENMKFHIIHFMQEYVNSKGQVALVPSFVLGDADSVRYVPTTTLNTADSDSFKRAFITILQQELQCFSQIDAFNNWCNKDENNYNSLAPASAVFTYFPALERAVKQGTFTIETIKQDLNDLNTSEFYDKYIKKSLEEGYQDFERTLVGKGLAIEVENKVALNSKVFPTAYTEELYKNRNEAEGLSPLKVLFLNMKFGEIQHIQFSGISPAFYAGTEDMQKRWKEQVASGTTLDRDAIDARTNNPVNPSFTQRVAYFKDESVPTTVKTSKEGYVLDSNSDVITADTKEGALGKVKSLVSSKSIGRSLFGKLLDKIDVDTSIYDKFKAVKGEDGKYHIISIGSSQTDGQALRSLESYRQIMIMHGDWDKNPANQLLYDEIIYVREHNIDLFASEHRDRLERILALESKLQPLKPFYYGYESVDLDNGTFNIPTQHKYAEMVLIPELLPKNSKLRMMGEAMLANNVDLLASDKCVKVGGWGQASLNFESQEALNSSLAHGSACFHHTLDLEGFIIQNNVPYHMASPSGEGTQVRKIAGYTGTTVSGVNRKLSAVANIAGTSTITLAGNSTVDLNNPSGKDCQRLFTALETANWINQLKKFVNKVRQPKQLTELVERCIRSDSRAANDILLGLDMNDNGKRNVPLSEGIFTKDLIAKILSIFRKDAIKQTCEGGMAVQVSPIGQDLDMIFDDNCYKRNADGTFVYDENGKRVVKEDADPENCLYAEGAGTWDFSYIGTDGKPHELEYLDYVDPATGRLLKEDGTICRQGEETESKLYKQFPKIMDILAYRIPTERAYSVINLRMVKFFPKQMGSILAVPDAYTTIAGFDFDIDKLYLIRQSFVQKKREFTDEEVSSIWRDIYNIKEVIDPETGDSKWDTSEASDIYKALKAARTSTLEKLRNNKEALKNIWSDTVARLKEHKKEFDKANKDLAKVKSGNYNGVGNVSLSDEQIEMLNKFIADNFDNDDIKDLEKEKQKLKMKLLAGFKTLKKEAAEARTLYEDAVDAYTETLANRLFTYWDQIDHEELGVSETAKEFFDTYVAGIEGLEWETYNGKALHTNPQGVIDNIKLGYYWDRLQSEETLKERFSPGGFYNIIAATPAMQRVTRNALDGIDSVEQLLGDKSYKIPNDDPSNIATVNHYQTANTIYGQLIGKAAVQNINQKLVAMCSKCELEEPILFGSMIKRAAASSMLGESKVGKDFISRYKDSEGTDSDLLLAELLSSAVDAVKQATLEYFGITPATFSLAACSIRLGATFSDVGLLLNQPVIKEATRLMEKNKRLPFNRALDEALKQLTSIKFLERVDGEWQSVTLDEETLFFGIKEYKGGYKENNSGVDPEMQDYYVCLYQRAVVEKVKALTNSASMLSRLVTGSRQDSANAVGSREASIECGLKSAEQLVKTLLGKKGPCPISLELSAGKKTMYNFDSIFDSKGNVSEEVLLDMIDSPFGIPQMMLHAFKELLNSLKGEFATVSEGYMSIKGAIHSLTSTGVAQEDLIAAANEDLATYILSRVSSDSRLNIDPRFNPNSFMDVVDSAGTKTTVTTKEYFKYHFAVNLSSLFAKHDKLKEKYFIFSIIDIETNKYGTPYIQFNNIGGIKGNSKNLLMDSWSMAMQDDNPEIRRAAELLFFYNFHTRGTAGFGINVCNSLTSTYVKNSIQGYLEIAAELQNVKVDSEGNIILRDNIIGTVNEFVQLLLVNRANKMHQYTAYVSEEEAKTLLALSGASGMGAFYSAETDKTYKDLNLTININSPIVKNKTELYDSHTNTPIGHECRLAPILKIQRGDVCRTYILDTNYSYVDGENREYVLDDASLSTGNVLNGNRAFADISDVAEIDTEYNTKQRVNVVHARYKLVALNEADNGGRLSTYTTDYSPIEESDFDLSNMSKVYNLPELEYNPTDAIDDNQAGTETNSVFTPVTTMLQDALAAYGGDMIVFDTETTGLDTDNDDIVQIAAYKIRNGEVIDTFNVILETEKEIPEVLSRKHTMATLTKEEFNALSEHQKREIATNGFTVVTSKNPLKDVYSSSERTTRKKGLEDFMNFVGNRPIVGHNSNNFDVPILESNLRRELGIDTRTLFQRRFDTMEISKAINASFRSHRLEKLIELLNLRGSNNHEADVDAKATVNLLAYLMHNIPSRLVKVPSINWSETINSSKGQEALYELLLVADEYIEGRAELSEKAKSGIAYLATRAAIFGQDAVKEAAKYIARKENKFGLPTNAWNEKELERIAEEQNLCN